MINLQHDKQFGEFARQVSLSGSGWAAEYHATVFGE